MRLLVCGSRNWTDLGAIHAVLRGNYSAGSTLVHGHARRGADRIADIYGRQIGWQVERHPADWDRHGNSAGPIRNVEMLAAGRPDAVWAFRSSGISNGTDHMISIATAAGVPVYVVTHPKKGSG